MRDAIKKLRRRGTVLFVTFCVRWNILLLFKAKKFSPKRMPRVQQSALRCHHPPRLRVKSTFFSLFFFAAQIEHSTQKKKDFSVEQICSRERQRVFRRTRRRRRRRWHPWATTRRRTSRCGRLRRYYMYSLFLSLLLIFTRSWSFCLRRRMVRESPEDEGKDAMAFSSFRA